MPTDHLARAHFDEPVTNLRRTYTAYPIVIVPGVMGTRLKSPSGELAWNPLGNPAGDSPGLVACRGKFIRDMSLDLLPVEDSDDALNSRPFQDLQKIKHERRRIKGSFSLVWDSYGDLAMSLIRGSLRRTLKKNGMLPDVYAFGYDWRKSNHAAANRLVSFMRRIKARRGQKIMIFCHSMGGLVSRLAYAKAPELFRGLILCASPNLGAPSGLSFLKHGARLSKTEKTQFAITFMLGLTTRSSRRTFLRSMPSMYEILPNPHYASRKMYGAKWLQFDSSQTGYGGLAVNGTPSRTGVAFSNCRSPSPPQPLHVYLDIYTGPMDTPNERFHVLTKLTNWIRLNAAVMLGGGFGKLKVPPKTLLLFAKHIPTHTKSRIDSLGTDDFFVHPNGFVELGPSIRDVPLTLFPKVRMILVEALMGDGDETIPRRSACPLKSQRKALFQHQPLAVRLTQGTHMGIATTSECRKVVRKYILRNDLGLVQ